MSQSTIPFYDVIIVGAGPAGATLAYELAKANIKVLVLEKDKFPRYKACAGGITVRAANLLPFDINSVIERVVYGARLSYKFDYKLTRFYDKPIAYMVTRDKFDYLLSKQAQDAGAELVDGQRVVQLETKAEKVKVFTETNAFFTRVVVGADGANSIVAKRLGLARDFYYGLGLETEVYVAKDDLSKWDDLIELDLGTIPIGYGWLFPKENHLSIGVAGHLRFAKRLRPYLKRLLESYSLANCEVKIFSGALMPVRKKGTPIAGDRGLLVGDAAGLIDALTGEGIYYAIRSTRLAAPAIRKFLAGELPDLQGYEKAIDDELMPELGVTRALATLLGLINTGAPRLFFKLFAESERACRALYQILRGEKTYVSVKQRLGPFQFLLDLLAK